jgi:hypothetical protein
MIADFQTEDEDLPQDLLSPLSVEAVGGKVAHLPLLMRDASMVVIALLSFSASAREQPISRFLRNLQE